MERLTLFGVVFWKAEDVLRIAAECGVRLTRGEAGELLTKHEGKLIDSQERAGVETIKELLATAAVKGE